MYQSKAKLILFWLSGLFITLVTIVIILEGGARIFKLAPQVNAQAQYVADPHLPYKPKPLSKMENRTDEFVDIYQYNSEGFRDHEHDYHKPEDVF